MTSRIMPVSKSCPSKILGPRTQTYSKIIRRTCGPRWPFLTPAKPHCKPSSPADLRWLIRYKDNPSTTTTGDMAEEMGEDGIESPWRFRRDWLRERHSGGFAEGMKIKRKSVDSQPIRMAAAARIVKMPAAISLTLHRFPSPPSNDGREFPCLFF